MRLVQDEDGVAAKEEVGGNFLKGAGGREGGDEGGKNEQSLQVWWSLNMRERVLCSILMKIKGEGEEGDKETGQSEREKKRGGEGGMEGGAEGGKERGRDLKQDAIRHELDSGVRGDAASVISDLVGHRPSLPASFIP